MKQTLDKKFDLLVINAGDAIRRWTNDYWKSPVHRVMQIPGEPELQRKLDENEETRKHKLLCSILFYTTPGSDTMLTRLPIGAGPIQHSSSDSETLSPYPSGYKADEKDLYPPVSNVEHFLKKLALWVDPKNDAISCHKE